VSLFYYKYPLIEKPHTFEEIQIIGKRDLAAMKLHAIEERGTRRDFIDLFFIANDYSLDEIIELYDQKYGVLDDHLYSIVRALNYFEDAERELSMPKMLVDVSWEDVKRFFKRESLRLAKEKLGV